MEIIAYAPRILRTLDEICDVFGVGPRTVRDWVRRGAPIAVEGRGRRIRYSAEAARLQQWRVAAYPPTHATTATPERPVNPSPDAPRICARYAPDDRPENPVLGSE